MRDLTDAELRSLVEPVKDRDDTEWNEEQVTAELELEIREHESGDGVRFETLQEAAKHPVGTVPISMRMPVELLDRVRREAERRHMPYQRLMRELIEAGLASGSGALPRLEISAELVERLARDGALTVEVRRAARRRGAQTKTRVRS
jgi:predicted DNA binding CopG/RHH family protein